MEPSIRNFSIIAHIDHGKTTLTDQFLRLTQTVAARNLTERMMDSNPIEKERGITIKLAPVRMKYGNYILNLIDTPGHVDFGYEVSRSLAACEGAVLVIDATQGVQAQTLSNFEKATALGLKVIPIINKIDLPSADIERVTLEVMEVFGVKEEEILGVSAKTGQNIESLLQRIIDVVPAPKVDKKAPLRALVFTSYYDVHKGVIAYVRVVDGTLVTGQKLELIVAHTSLTATEVGVFSPNMEPTLQLAAGEVGYICTGLKEVGHVKVGDTLTTSNFVGKVELLPGYKEPQPMVYMELYPIDGDDFMLLTDAMSKLHLNDAALTYTGTHSVALGNGLRVGFLGILHADIVRERLEREFELELIATSPSVTYRVINTAGEQLEITNPSQLPDSAMIRVIEEPMTHATLLTPKNFLGAVMQLAEEHRGKLISMVEIGERVKVRYDIPLAEIITQFHDDLKSVTSGFGSLEYDVFGYQAADVVRVSIMVNHENIEALSCMMPRDAAESRARRLVTRLKEVIPKQMFEIPIQAAIGGKIIARETVSAYRKDVTAKLYGGDVTRRMKLLSKQAKGKKRMKSMGKVELPQEAFLAVLKQ